MDRRNFLGLAGKLVAAAAAATVAPGVFAEALQPRLAVESDIIYLGERACFWVCFYYESEKGGWYFGDYVTERPTPTQLADLESVAAEAFRKRLVDSGAPVQVSTLDGQ